MTEIFLISSSVHGCGCHEIIAQKQGKDNGRNFHSRSCPSKNMLNRNDKSEHIIHLDNVVRIIIVWSRRWPMNCLAFWRTRMPHRQRQMQISHPIRSPRPISTGAVPRHGRQRRLRRRCPRQHGILTAKFHWLGAKPLKPHTFCNASRFETHF